MPRSQRLPYAQRMFNFQLFKARFSDVTFCLLFCYCSKTYQIVESVALLLDRDALFKRLYD